MIRHLLGEGFSIDVITFNYDIGLEIALRNSGLTFDYGIADNQPEADLNLYKLHGSVNWSRSECGTISCPTLDRMNLESRRAIDDLFAVDADGRCHIRRGLITPPTESIGIIPPIESKSESRRDLSRIWRSASESFKRCDILSVAGYSMPATDEFFQHFLLASSIEKTPLRRVFLCNQDGDAQRRISEILSPNFTNHFRKHIVNCQDFVKLPSTMLQVYSDTNRLF